MSLTNACATQVTKDNLLSHIVKLWYRTEGCPEKFAFNAGECLKSGFARVGIFPFAPDVIRKTVRPHNDPEILSGIRVELQEQDFSPLYQVLQERFNIGDEKDLEDYKQYTLLKQRGITPGAALANSIQKFLFAHAPKKQRRPKNKQLSTDSGALITSASFVAQTEIHESQKKVEKADVLAKRKMSAASTPSLKEKANEPKAKKARKS